MTTVRQIKARLRKSAISVTIFDSSKKTNDEQKEFVPLDVALAAIDDLMDPKSLVLSHDEIKSKLSLDKHKS